MKGSIFLFALFSSLLSFAQQEVEWAFSFDNETDSVVVVAKIQPGWHLYSQHIDNELGPIPTSFSFKPNENYKLVGGVIEPKAIMEYDPNFEGELHFFKDEVSFKQKIELKKSTEIEGMVTYMVCNDVMCMPPSDVEFKITIK
jgi:thiol:disulfide interchange protein DsbD